MQNIPCENCKKPFDLPDPVPQILRNHNYNAAIYLQPYQRCPHCGQAFVFQLLKVDVISVTWVPVEVKEKSKIVAPPGGFDPNPKIIM